MKKFIFCIFVSFLIVTPIFAESLDEAEGKAAKKASKNFVQQFENTYESSSFLGELVDKIMLQFVNIHNQAFGTEEVTSSLQLPKFTLNGRFNFAAGNIFKLLLSLFLVTYFLVYSIKLSLDMNFQYKELVNIFFRFIVCMVIFVVLPYLPTILIKIAFSFAEIITGSKDWDYGHTSMTYSTPIDMATSSGAIFLKGIVGLSLASLIEIGVSFFASFTFDAGSLIGLMVNILVAIYLAGILLAFIVALKFCIRCLDLYITNFIMILILPGTLLKGWGQDNFLGYDSKTLLKYYFVNFVEIFVGALTILIVGRIYGNLLEHWGNPSVTKKLFLSIIQFITQPLLLLILMPATSKILSSLLNGSVSDNNADITGAYRTVMGTGLAIGGGKPLQKIAKNAKAKLNSIKSRNNIATNNSPFLSNNPNSGGGDDDDDTSSPYYADYEVVEPTNSFPYSYTSSSPFLKSSPPKLALPPPRLGLPPSKEG